MYTAGRRQCIRVDIPCCMTTSGPDVNESVRNASLRNPAWIPAPARREEVNIKGERDQLKEKRKSVVLHKNTTSVSEDEMVKSRQHQY